MQNRLDALQGELAITKANSEETINSYMNELRSQLAKAREDNQMLTKRMEALEHRNAELALAEEQKVMVAQDLQRMMHGMTLPDFVTRKLVIVIGLSPVGRSVAELLVR